MVNILVTVVAATGVQCAEAWPTMNWVASWANLSNLFVKEPVTSGGTDEVSDFWDDFKECCWEWPPGSGKLVKHQKHLSASALVQASISAFVFQQHYQQNQSSGTGAGGVADWWEDFKKCCWEWPPGSGNAKTRFAKDGLQQVNTMLKVTNPTLEYQSTYPVAEN